MSYDCPQCDSQQTVSFEMMYARGTSSGTITGSTVTFSGDIGITSGQFNSQTVLAGRVAPPVLPKMGCSMQILIGIGAWLLGSVVGAVIVSVMELIFGRSNAATLLAFSFILIGVFLICGLHFYKRFIERKQMPVYREQLEEWSNSMICQRCGFMWTR